MNKKTLFHLLSGLLFFIGADANASLSSADNTHNTKLSSSNIPLYFVENSGQVNESVAYYSKTPDFTLWLSPDALVFDKNTLVSPGREETVRDVSRMTFLDSEKEITMSSLGETRYRVNYYKRGGGGWKTDIKTYESVLYHEIYDGIDLKVYGVTSSIEYDWIVKPGSRPEAIAFKYNDIDSSEIDGDGNIVINTRFSRMVHKKPFAYQTIDGKRVVVDVGFNQRSDDVYGFVVGAYDEDVELVIDPVVLTYSTYLGGATNPGDVSAFPQDYGKAIAVDGSGNAYVTGSTKSTDFPTANAYDTALDSYVDTVDTIYPNDVFVTKFSADGSSLLFSTYIGGSRADEGTGIAVDAAGNAYVTGSTQSSDFPTTAGVVSTAKNDASTSSTDAFVVKLSSAGAMVYSTFLGGDASDVGNGIAVDATGNAHIVGSTYSTDYPVPNAYDFSVNLYWDGVDWIAYSTIFVTKLNATATAISYSSYFGAREDEPSLSDEGNAIALDASGNIYITGITKSSQFPLKNPYDSTYQGYPANSTDFSEAVVLKIDPSQSGSNSLVFSTFLGGTGGDWGYGIDLDDAGDIYVAGMTRSGDFPTAGPYQSSHGGGSNDGFVAKLNYTGSTLSLVYSTYLGGSGNDTVRAIAVNGDGYAFVTGETDSSDFPTLNAYDGSYSASQDLFVTLFAADGDALEYSTYLGSTGQDVAYGIALDSSDAAYVVGTTASTDFPTVGPYMTNPGDGTTQDAFVSKLSYTIPVPPTVTTTTASAITSNSADSGGNVTSDGGATVTARGVCWSTSADPVSGGADSCTTDGAGSGGFTSSLTGLAPATTYHYRAYAMNSKGTAYGADHTFSTSLGPDLTLAISNDAGGTITLGENWTWTLSLRNPGDTPAVFADGQVILTDQLPDTGIAYGAATVSNVSNVTNQGFVSANIAANTLTVTASGGSVTIGAATGGFDLRFTATPSAAGTFVNPMGGGLFKVDPDNVIAESDEGNNTATDTVTTNSPPPLPPPIPRIHYNGQVISRGGTVVNAANHSDVSIGRYATVANRGSLTDLSNRGTVSGGEVSGHSTNAGTFSNLTVTAESTVTNLGGTLRGGTNGGRVYGGSVEGSVRNEGLIYGGAPEGGEEGVDYSVTFGANAVVEGGTVGGVVTHLGELRNVTLMANSVITLEGDSSGASGILTGTITILGDSGSGTITLPSGVSFPPAGSGTRVLTPQLLVAYANDQGWFSEGSVRTDPELPELGDDLLIIAGMVVSPSGIRISQDLSVTLTYDPSEIPDGFVVEDLELRFYDRDSASWRTADFESVDVGAIRFTTDLASAYALVLPTAGTASPILNVQRPLNPRDRHLTLSGPDLTDVTAAPTLLVPEERLNESGFLFMCAQFDDGASWCYEDLSENADGPNPVWRRHAEGDAILPFDERILNNPQLTFDVDLANMNLAGGDSFEVNVYIAVSRTETLADYRGAAYRLTFE